ncbi:unnamed protein product [Cochlearia groenlandica]
MASESSQTSSPSPSPSPSPPLGDNVVDRFVGSFISLISKYEIRYEGILYHLNVQDSTLGLKNVRSCGTEGRKKDGPQVPPGDKVYDYILFRGSDIKDLKVNPSSSAQSGHESQKEQDIDQSTHTRPDMISPLSRHDSGNVYGRGAQWAQTPALSCRSVSTTQHSSIPLSFQPPSATAGILTQSPVSLIGSNQSNAGSSMPMPSFVHGNKQASTDGHGPLGMMHQSVSSSPMYNEPEIVDPFASPIMGLVNDTSQVFTHTPDVATNPPYISNPSPLGQVQYHTPPGLASSPSDLSPLSEASLYGSNIQSSYPIAPQALGKAVYDPQSNHPNQSIPYELPPVTHDSAPVIPGPLSNSPRSFYGMEALLQSRQPIVNRGQEMFGASNPVSVDVQSQSLPNRNYPPLRPPPVSAHQSRIPSSGIEFTEEFDFEAMNEKFNKSELWGFLGKNNQRNQNDYRQAAAGEPNAEGNTKPAYSKDDFFDTISCNSLISMARGGHQQQQHTQFPEHMRQNPEAFGNHFQRPPPLQPGQGAYLAAQSNYNGGYNNNYYPNSGYGYYNGGRGRGGNTHF